MANYLTQYLEIKDKNEKIVSNDIRLIAKKDKFITFENVNKIYKKISSKYKTKNIQILITNSAGRKSMIKKLGENVDDLEYDNEEYYNKMKKEDRKKFDNFTSVQFILKNNKNKV